MAASGSIAKRSAAAKTGMNSKKTIQETEEVSSPASGL
jgi:hypothetical protein